MKITARLFEKMKGSAGEAFAALEGGKSAFRVIADMHLRALPECSAEEAEAVALRIVNEVRAYHAARRAASDHGETWIAEQIDRLCEGRTRLERCRLMAQMIDGMIMMNGDASGEFVPGRRAAGMTAENTTRREEEALRGELERAIAACGLGEAGMEELSGLLDECGLDEAAELVTGFGEKQHDADAVYAMIAYLNGQNRMPGFDRALTPEEAAVAVCAGGERLRTAHRVSVGELTREAGAKLLKIIGSVAGFLLDLALCLMVGGAALLTLYALSVLMDFGMAVVIAGAAAAALLTGAAMFSGTVRLGQKAAELPVKLARGAAGLVAKGWRMLSEACRGLAARPMRIRMDEDAERTEAAAAEVSAAPQAVPADA